MAATLRLRHMAFTTTGKVFVLGGKTVKVNKGVVEVDISDRRMGALVALALWHLGYRIDEDGKEIRRVGDLDSIIAEAREAAQVDAFVAAVTAAAEADPED